MGTLLTHMVPLCEFRKGCLLSRWLVAPQAKGNGNPLQYSCLENSVDRGTWWALSMGSHRVGHNWSDLACIHALEKEMATHSSILAWRIPGTEESGGLPSMGSHRVGHNWSDLAAVTVHVWGKNFSPSELRFSIFNVFWVFEITKSNKKAWDLQPKWLLASRCQSSCNEWRHRTLWCLQFVLKSYLMPTHFFS